MRLTARSVEAAKPQPGKRLEIADHVVRGLSLRVSAAGTKSWAVRYRVEGGLQRRLTLGAFPAVTLEKARAAVTATYLRHRFDVEKRAALSAWSTLLMRIVLTDAREHVGACVAVATIMTAGQALCCESPKSREPGHLGDRNALAEIGASDPHKRVDDL